MEAKKKITFDDIARYTNFSKTTISRYFNNPDSLAPESQRIISEALAKLDYKENKVARILANGQTEFIGIILPEFYHRFFSEVLNQILSTYETYGYKFLVFVGNRNEESERRYIQELMSYQIEGMLVLSHTISSEELAQLQIPIVTMEREDRQVCSVNTDNYSGGYQAAALLDEHGCDVLIHINSPTDPQIPAYGRITGFQDYCKEHGLRHEVMFRPVDRSHEEDQAILEDIIATLEEQYQGQKKGVFLSNDTLASTLLNLLFRKYGHLPEDYRIVGFDNSPASREAIIPISTVGQQVDKLAQEAVGLVVEQINARKEGRPLHSRKPVHKIIEPVLVRRASTEGWTEER
ncbi:LacI family transcriptional regulator [Pseudoflavonifractor sp. AF19-9AC]|uniref:LacI family DNA-binding transcriptional regulator n=1 Tax=Pseudoflavonifractor sp. AF19-9AC TaxID=2292244 RepID=UPI000E4C0042|nr:substrate-binding domain-containing protein [Pseudoflavonifractor sp. AF19-9AC]RHR10127.1 LacI family transcriptional regulator [Pseudoflavonifractor sp. AF19-9AC]